MVMTTEKSEELQKQPPAPEGVEQVPEKENVPYEEGTITVFTGLRGSGKTCKLASVGMQSLSDWRRRTYSNFPIGGYIMGKYYESEPLPNDVFVTYAKDIPPGSVLVVDELQEFFDRQDWYTVQSKMGTSMFAQIRKLNIIIFGSTQFFSHLNGRIAEQVDYMLQFKDLYFSEWGLKYHIPKGNVAQQNWYNLCGGPPDGKSARNEFHPHLITGKAYRKTTFFAKAYWEYFNSHLLTALNQRFQTFYMEKQKIKVGDNGGRQPTEAQIALRSYVVSAFNKLYSERMKKIKAGDLLDMARAKGFDTDFRQLGGLLYNLGIEKERTGSGFFYIVKEL